jgi:hypothetical protein
VTLWLNKVVAGRSDKTPFSSLLDGTSCLKATLSLRKSFAYNLQPGSSNIDSTKAIGIMRTADCISGLFLPVIAKHIACRGSRMYEYMTVTVRRRIPDLADFDCCSESWRADDKTGQDRRSTIAKSPTSINKTGELLIDINLFELRNYVSVLIMISSTLRLYCLPQPVSCCNHENQRCGISTTVGCILEFPAKG